MDGFLLVDKESGWTSRDICNKVQSIFHVNKVGHIGTLDPFATGLMVVSVGKATKAGRFIEDLDKTYIATLKLGKKTDTGDLSGNAILEKEIKPFTIKDIKDTFYSLLGVINQIPPMTSAIHVNGVKLYKLAHQGKVVDRPSREVVINSIDLIKYSNDEISFMCSVGKGTYIRTLGEMIAEKLDNVGHLTSLRRIKIGDIDLINSHKVKELKQEYLLNPSKLLTSLPKITLKNEMVEKVKSGVQLNFECDFDIILLVDEFDNAIAVYSKIDNHLYKCLRGLW